MAKSKTNKTNKTSKPAVKVSDLSAKKNPKGGLAVRYDPVKMNE